MDIKIMLILKIKINTRITNIAIEELKIWNRIKINLISRIAIKANRMDHQIIITITKRLSIKDISRVFKIKRDMIISFQILRMEIKNLIFNRMNKMGINSSKIIIKIISIIIF
jgi:hypothetical protein